MRILIPKPLREVLKNLSRRFSEPFLGGAVGRGRGGRGAGVGFLHKTKYALLRMTPKRALGMLLVLSELG